MPAMGLEPIRGCPQQILSLPRLPFRHAGNSNNRVIYYHNRTLLESYLFFYDLLKNIKAVKSCKIIFRSFSTSDQLYTAVLL